MESGLYARAGTPLALRGEATRDVRLIETMLWDGQRIARLALHMDRLAAAASALGWPFSLAAVQAALPCPPGAARLRLTLDAQGAVQVEVGALPLASARWRVGVAAARLASDDPWLRVKSTRRASYDAARATLPAGLDEVIFLNERGEVCDGTITTVFFDAGAGLMTPPLQCGLLPGVLRAVLLAEGRCGEAVLPMRDLPAVRLWVGNALRGLIAADWVA